ncbi:MAG: 23S rRNA (guanosine(2251)-2'-O)-methyltransferase RlmB [Oscillospiraceae bacterium]|jgi:23S rRNA (guanosine2251-2'-O)-methyltransferase|nr:23S rRNA (guanosine(2251)-2'-O)-methyltransferase RlmB [Oscillospiraceae bacterium]
MNVYDTEALFGKNAVTEALRAELAADTLYVAAKQGGLTEIITLAKERGAVVKEVPLDKLSALCGNAKHQGVVLTIASAQYVSVEELLSHAEARGTKPLLVIADGIEDPHNLGAIIRSAESAGADGLIIPKRGGVSVNGAVFRASAGAAAHLKVCRATNLNDTVRFLKDNGVWLYCAAMDGEVYTKQDYTVGTAFVIGSEGRGVSRLLRQNCDAVVSLPMNGKINSLNASVSAGIFLYEAIRQRQSGLEKLNVR